MASRSISLGLRCDGTGMFLCIHIKAKVRSKTMQLIFSFLVTVCLVPVIWLIVAQASVLDVVSEKLERYASSADDSSGVTYDELEAAHDEVKLRGKKWRGNMRHTKDSFKLLDDFVFLPMDDWRPSEEEDEPLEQFNKLKKSYVKRAERTYKQFWPAYVDKKTIIDRSCWGASMFNALTQILYNQSGGEVTQQLLWNYKIQINQTRKKLEEIAHHEDIYSRLDDIHLMLNLLNNDSAKDIDEYCLIGVEKKSDITVEKLEECVQKFRSLFGVRGSPAQRPELESRLKLPIPVPNPNRL